VSHAWIEKTAQKPIDFHETRETSGDRFHQFSENRPIKYEIFKNLKKILKELESISSFLVEFKNSK
jgi:hypothetical protein